MDLNVKKMLEGFFNKFSEETFKKNEILISPNESPHGVYFLKKGLIREFTISSSGEEVTLNIYKEGSFFPMAWVLNRSLPKYHFEAHTPVVVNIAPPDKFLLFLKDSPDVMFDLIIRIYSGLEGVFSRMENLMAGNAQSRLAAEIIIHAKRFGVSSGKKELKVNLTERELAALSGITRETVSREIRKLKERGLIEFKKGCLVIKDLLRLEEKSSV